MESVDRCVEDGYDVIVVGSGYGGSVAACRLSMAGATVCLLEKGRRWGSTDFPTGVLGIKSAVRVDSAKRGFSFGSRTALFQIREEGDSLCCVACGLGGGSLVSAGVLAPTPAKTRRSEKWPAEWNEDWEVCQAKASAMLGAKSSPVEFSNAKVMSRVAEEVEIEELKKDSFNLSINFNVREPKSAVEDHCVACGNCITGCPYNAKNSTDKNYLASAIEAGCVVMTECEALYIVKNPVENLNPKDYEDRARWGGGRKRRWRVYFCDLEYASADFVILSAGVLGTTKVLFESAARGLRLSPRLGDGFSCNGDNLAYIVASRAPLNSYGLNKNQFTKTPFHGRPGPSISSSYTSSLGFTIQPTVLPTSYPYLVFKGIATYGWPNGVWFVNGLVDKLKNMVGFKDTQAVMLTLMGHDSCDGKIRFNADSKTIHFTSSHDPLLPRKIEALVRITKRLGGVLFMSRYRSTSVNLLGGCNASCDPSHGVCNPKGQVFDTACDEYVVHEGLYVCDASLIPCSVGANPVLTIAAAAEHVSRNLVSDFLGYRAGFQPTKISKESNRVDLHEEDEEATCSGLVNEEEESNVVGREKVTIRETLRGNIGGMPCAAHFILKMNSRNSCNPVKAYERNIFMGDPHPLLKGVIGGYVTFSSIDQEPLYVIDGNIDMCKVDNRTPYTQYMLYQLVLISASGSRYLMEGKRVMNPYLLAFYAWTEMRTLHVKFKSLGKDNKLESEKYEKEKDVELKGELYLSVLELLRSLLSMKGTLKYKFLCLVSQSLWRTFIWPKPRVNKVRYSRLEKEQTPYPPHTLYELNAGDGQIISFRRWRIDPNVKQSPSERIAKYPVLLLNGHSTESYFLPTEPKDLVRTLLEAGHETWLLQPRLHPFHASNNFTFEDIAKFDIPAVITKIQEVHDKSIKIHVVAHCVGGLAIHMAIMGGFVFAKDLVSLSCTNSSMFFKLTTSALIKMRLPLLPASMAILGSNTIISLFDMPPNESPRHRFLKWIARLIPRPESCTMDECNVFSGIFGSTFWHENVSERLHRWLYKESVSRLPMSGFPHLRKICRSGFIVGPDGQNEYLIHPERMSLPTLYISGGRSILVKPETTFLAHRYMKLHQPSYRHKRVIVEGFGHSDLLIGEDAHKQVFPHFVSHMQLAEQGIGEVQEDKNLIDPPLVWEGGHDGDESFGGGCSFICFLLVVTMGLVLVYFADTLLVLI